MKGYQSDWSIFGLPLIERLMESKNHFMAVLYCVISFWIWTFFFAMWYSHWTHLCNFFQLGWLIFFLYFAPPLAPEIIKVCLLNRIFPSRVWQSFYDGVFYPFLGFYPLIQQENGVCKIFHWMVLLILKFSLDIICLE